MRHHLRSQHNQAVRRTGPSPEDVPRGQSIRARLVIVEVEKDDLRWDELSVLQKAAAEGTFSACIAAFVRHLAADLDAVKRRFAERRDDLREIRLRGPHRRTASAMAELECAWELFIDFAITVGATDAVGGQALMARVRAGLEQVAGCQELHQVNADASARYVQLLGSALASGTCHLAGEAGGPPDTPECWGWRRLDGAASWASQGTRVGHLSVEGVFIDPDAAYVVVMRAAEVSGEGLGVSEKTLRKRLFEAGKLTGRDESRSVYTVRKAFSGQRRDFLWFSPELFGGLFVSHSSDHPDHSESQLSGTTGSGRVSGRVGLGIGRDQPGRPTTEHTLSPGSAAQWSGWSGPPTQRGVQT